MDIDIGISCSASFNKFSFMFAMDDLCAVRLHSLRSRLICFLLHSARLIIIFCLCTAPSLHLINTLHRWSGHFSFSWILVHSASRSQGLLTWAHSPHNAFLCLLLEHFLLPFASCVLPIGRLTYTCAVHSFCVMYCCFLLRAVLFSFLMHRFLLFLASLRCTLFSLACSRSPLGFLRGWVCRLVSSLKTSRISLSLRFLSPRICVLFRFLCAFSAFIALRFVPLSSPIAFSSLIYVPRDRSPPSFVLSFLSSASLPHSCHPRASRFLSFLTLRTLRTPLRTRNRFLVLFCLCALRFWTSSGLSAHSLVFVYALSCSSSHSPHILCTALFLRYSRILLSFVHICCFLGLVSTTRSACLLCCGCHGLFLRAHAFS